MITVYIKDNKAILKENDIIILKLDASSKKGHYTYKTTENNNMLNNVVSFVVKNKANGTMFIKWLNDNYPICISISKVTELLSGINKKSTAKNLIMDAEKLGIVKHYCSYWKVPKENLIDIYNYLQNIKTSN